MKGADIPIAFFVFLVSSGLAALSYVRLVTLESPTPLFGRSIPIGSSTQQVLQHGRCIGTFKTEFKDAGTRTIETSGDVSIRYKGDQDIATISFTGTFNPLGQLYESTMAMTALGTSVTIHTEDTNPLSIDIRVHTGNKSYSRSTKIPGPLVISHKAKLDPYELHYVPLGAAEESIIPGIIAKAFNETALTLTEGSAERCSREGNFLEVTPMIKGVQGFARQFLRSRKNTTEVNPL